MKRLKMDVSRTSSSLYSGAMVPNVNANVQQLYFQFLSDPMNEAQLLQDKKLIAQGTMYTFIVWMGYGKTSIAFSKDSVNLHM